MEKHASSAIERAAEKPGRQIRRWDVIVWGTPDKSKDVSHLRALRTLLTIACSMGSMQPGGRLREVRVQESLSRTSGSGCGYGLLLFGEEC
jgi:hypothetical protein